MADQVRTLADYCRHHWYSVLWLVIALAWLPATALLPGLATSLLSSNSLKVELLGFLVAAVQGLSVVAAAVTISAATTTKMLDGPIGEVPARTAWALIGSLWLLLTSALAVPTGLWVALETARSWWNLPLGMLLVLMLTWAALLATAAGEVGARRAPGALAACWRSTFGFVSLRGGLTVILLSSVLAALSALGLRSGTYLYLASLALTASAAVFALLWHAASGRTAPQGGGLRASPQVSGLPGARREVLEVLRRRERA